MKSKATLEEREEVHGEFFFLGELISFHGPRVSSDDLSLPEGVQIVPWDELPTMVWLKVNGVTVAGPSRRGVMNSFAMKHSPILNEIVEHGSEGLEGFFSEQ